jgi:hypothetical protein
MVPTVNSKAADIIELKEDYSESNLLQLQCTNFQIFRNLIKKINTF